MKVQPKRPTLVLLRHGQSEWNRANLFTGWVDVDLTQEGIREARQAGQVLCKQNLKINKVYTSLLKRAVRTSCLLLSVLNQTYTPILKDVRLNEQHPGALCGQNKRQLAEKYGANQVMQWRRSWDNAPPHIDASSPLQLSIAQDVRYSSLCTVPSGESLRECCDRVNSLWEEELKPALQAGQTVIVVSHGNTLRGLIKAIDSISDEDIYEVDLPTAAPLVYSLDEQLRPIGCHGTWGDRGPPRRGRFLLSEEKIRRAQYAMRQQVLRDISVTSLGDAAVGETYTAPMANSRLVEFDGYTFNVRQRPPSFYESLKPAAIERVARREYEQWRWANIESGDTVVSGHKKRVRCVLILVRHGRSEQNAADLFSGWSDSELTSRGREQARIAGKILSEAGIKSFEKVYTSVLTRAVKSAWLMLDEMDLQWTPMHLCWRLNERHYGALQGRDKKDCVREFGLMQVQRWRRGLHDRPPEWSACLASDTIDRRYNQVKSDELPSSESLADCLARLGPFLEQELWPDMRTAVSEAHADRDNCDPVVPTFCVVSSENLIRALIMQTENLTADEVAMFNVPHATPLVVQRDASLKPLQTPWAASPLRCGWFMGDPARVAASIKRIMHDLKGSDRRARSEARGVLHDGDQEHVGSEDSCYLTDEREVTKWVCD